MPHAIWWQQPTKRLYETQNGGVYVTVIKTMLDTYSRLVVTSPATSQTSAASRPTTRVGAAVEVIAGRPCPDGKCHVRDQRARTPLLPLTTFFT